jgi:hypothetical protein
MAGARIYKPAKTAMQSGRAKTKNWILEFEPSSAKRPDKLMGWTGSQDMSGDQVRLRFAAKEQAIAFVEKCGIEYRVQEHAEKGVSPKSYAENFHPDRVPGNWTH